MNRKAISAFLIGCEPNELMAFANRGDHVGVVGPDGKKYIFTIEQLEDQEKKMKKVAAAEKKAAAAKRSAAAKRTAAAKKAADAKKPAAKPVTKKGPAKP